MTVLRSEESLRVFFPRRHGLRWVKRSTEGENTFPGMQASSRIGLLWKRASADSSEASSASEADFS